MCNYIYALNPGIYEKKYLSVDSHLIYIGLRIAAARHARGDTIETVAGNTGISKKIISQVENGRYPALKEITLKRLCDYLEIPLSELFDDK